MHRPAPTAAPVAPPPDAGGPVELSFVHRIHFDRDVLRPDHGLLAELIAPAREHGPVRVLPVVDAGVAEAWPDLAGRLDVWAGGNADTVVLAGEPAVVPGGEPAKQGWGVFETVARAIDGRGICRRSFVLAIGGGAVLDAVGFAASSVHRGVRLLRMPSTTLGQGDAGIGVKNGINAFGKKNALGAFAVPWAVVNDLDLLGTLDHRTWRAGFSESVKVGLLFGEPWWSSIAGRAEAIGRRDAGAAEAVLRETCSLHVRHIVEGGDPFETERARPLDFGHWSAHQLEALSGFTIPHGEAVAIGIAIDLRYAVELGRLDPDVAEDAIDVLRRMGFRLGHPLLADPDRLLDGLEVFREHLGGRLTVTLIEAIGERAEVHAIDRTAMTRAIRTLAGEPALEGAQQR